MTEVRRGMPHPRPAVRRGPARPRASPAWPRADRRVRTRPRGRAGRQRDRARCPGDRASRNSSDEDAAPRRGAPPMPRRCAICRGRPHRRSSTIWPSPALARAQRRNSSSISSSRPTSGLSADPRNASNRLATILSLSTCQTAHRLGCRWFVDRAEIAAVEQVADQTSGGRLDRHRVRLRRYLQPRGQVRRVADNLGGPKARRPRRDRQR